MSNNPHSESQRYRVHRSQRSSGSSDATPIRDWLADLWEGRYLILAATVLIAGLGSLLVWRAAPVYQAQSLLQLQEQKPANDNPSLAKLEGLFSQPSDAQAEVEILKSDLVLGRTATALGMDIFAEPKLPPFIGAALVRNKPDAPSIAIDLLQVPNSQVGQTFRLTALADGSIRWNAPDRSLLATGRPGEVMQAMLGGEGLKLRVRTLVARPGQEFLVARRPLPAVIADLRASVDASERGKMTNIVGLTCKAASPAQSAAILNELVNQYIRYKLERKNGDAARTRSLLEAKITPLKAELDASENRLNQYRSQHRSVDLSREAESMLMQNSAINTQIMALEQKKQEALRTYRENSDVVVTLDRQIQKLKEEVAQVSSQERALPATQQEVVRLSRDVQVNTDLYSALLNNVQQLQIASQGDVGSIAVVDPATPDPEPIGAKPPALLAFNLALGVLVGVGLAMLRQLARRGVQDHRLIESKLGIPVLVTIPHSRDQESQAREIMKNKPGPHLLSLKNPEDLAMESLRSLRTTLLFGLKAGAANHLIMVTGPSPQIGKSFVAANLAITLAQTGARVLLIDADLRRGSLHRHFGLKSRQGGLSELLAGRTGRAAAIHGTEFPNLDLVPTGTLPPEAAQLLLSAQFDGFLGEVAETYQYVLLDVPPLLPVTDATIIGAKAATVLLVVKAGQHSMDELRTCQQRLETHGIPLTGCIFNDIKPMGLGGYQNYRYAYHYKYR